jgi:hypothetical protein
MLLTVAALVAGTRSVDFLLVLIGAAKVIRVLAPPLPTRLLFLLAATVRVTAGLLPLLEPRMGIKATMTKRTSPLRKHSFSSSQPQKETQTERTRKEKKQKGKAMETCSEEAIRRLKNQAISEDNPFSKYWPVKRL